MATIVPVWFAVTFALSSLAVRGAIIERMVLASGLDLILPMATPPLGNTARFLIAALFAAVGAALGWGVMKMLRPATRPAAPAEPVWPSEERIRLREVDAHPDAPLRAPIRAHAELGPQGFDHVPPEALAPAPQAYAPYTPPPLAPAAFAPEPVAHEAPRVFTPPVIEPAPVIETVARPEPLVEPMPVLAPVAPVVPAFEAAAPLAPAPAPVPALSSAWLESETPFIATEPQPVAEPAPSPPETTKPAGFPLPPAQGPSAAEHIARAPIDALSHVELIERLAIAMERRRSADAAKAPAPAQPQSAPVDGTSQALRTALNALREVK